MKKWIFRLLTLIAVLCALALFGLKIVSGTSDSHKRGLEQAFSQIFKGDAKFGTLKTFNLFPQFSIEIEKLEISGIQQIGRITAEHALISFGPVDLLTKSRVIEDFHLKNVNVSEGLYTPLALQLDDVGIYPNDKQDAAQLNFTGKYGEQEFKAVFAMAMKQGLPAKYFFNETNDFTMNLGPVQISGLFSPYQVGGSSMSQIKMFAQKKSGRVECNLPPEKVIGLNNFLKDILGQIPEIKAPSDLNNLCSKLSK
jgi:hypothetical protein